MNIISTIFQNTMDSSEDLSSSNNNNIPLQNTSEYDLSLLQKQMYFILLLYCRDSLKTLLEENKSNNTFITPYTEYVKSIKEMIKNTPEEIDYSTTLNDICDYTVEVKMYISDLQMLQYIYISIFFPFSNAYNLNLNKTVVKLPLSEQCQAIKTIFLEKLESLEKSYTDREIEHSGFIVQYFELIKQLSV